MRKLSRLVLIRTLTVLSLIALPIIGADCEDIINQIANPCTGDNNIAGDWTLIYNAGTTNDICPGERLVLPSSTGGTATLTCPQGTGIQRNYTVSGTTLEYTQTGAQYNVQFTQSCEMVLSGINNNRILYYSATSGNPTDNKQQVSNPDASSNSSEINK